MNPIRNVLAAGTLAIATGLPLCALAADGTITFTGQITGQTCTVAGDGGSASSFTVALPTVSASALSTSGATSGRTPFSIRLSGCTPETGNVAVYFEPGATIDPSTGRLINTAAATPAANVQIGLRNADVSQITLGVPFASQNTQQVALASGAATLNYTAEYAATAAATAGTVSSSVIYSIVYP